MKNQIDHASLMCITGKTASSDFNQQHFPLGCHICYIYTDEEERRSIMSQIIDGGLSSGEKIAYLAVAPQVMEPHAFLSALGANPPSVLKPEQCLIADAEKTYCPDGAFIPERMLKMWRSLYRQSLEESFPGVRATGETSWLRQDVPGIERWFEYETMLNLEVSENPLMGIVCQYDARRLDGETLYTLLNIHPLMIVRGQIVHNPFYEPP